MASPTTTPPAAVPNVGAPPLQGGDPHLAPLVAQDLAAHNNPETSASDATMLPRGTVVPRYYGITPPIDERYPSPADLAAADALEQTLKNLGVFELESGRRERQAVIEDLAAVARAWCEDEWRLIQSSRLSDGETLDSPPPRCELRTFGSVKLDVHTPDADIDVVLIAPRHCGRAAFFGSLVARLEREFGPGRVMPVRDAYTPVIKLRCRDTDVDLLFVALDADCVPEPLNVLDDSLLRGLDEGAVRSLNGVRVAEMLLRLVPDVAVFRLALRAVKRWARAKGLYSNVLGLLGGVNCAILVAFVCQRYPNAAASTVVGRFFRIFDSWEWPHPVLIAPPAVPLLDDSSPIEDSRSYVAWNPRLNPRDRAHLAPIVTPAHPTMNSSYNVGEPQLRAIRDELKLGVDATRRVDRLAADIFNTASTSNEPHDSYDERIARLCDAWRVLFGPSNFFSAHRHYVQIDVVATDDDTLRRWFAWCESRLRGLVVALDTPGFVKARPHATPIEHRDASRRTVRSFFVGLSFETHVQHIDLTPCVRDFSLRVNNWEHLTNDMDLELDHVLNDQLPDWVWRHQEQYFRAPPSRLTLAPTLESSTASRLVVQHGDVASSSEIRSSDDKATGHATTSESDVPVAAPPVIPAAEASAVFQDGLPETTSAHDDESTTKLDDVESVSSVPQTASLPSKQQLQRADASSDAAGAPPPTTSQSEGDKAPTPPPQQQQRTRQRTVDDEAAQHDSAGGLTASEDVSDGERPTSSSDNASPTASPAKKPRSSDDTALEAATPIANGAAASGGGGPETPATPAADIVSSTKTAAAVPGKPLSYAQVLLKHRGGS